jgi:hypothetical protein
MDNLERETIKTEEGYDDFLSVVVHIRDLWVQSGGRELTDDELYDLNDKLAAFFAEMRYD